MCATFVKYGYWNDREMCFVVWRFDRQLEKEKECWQFYLEDQMSFNIHEVLHFIRLCEHSMAGHLKLFFSIRDWQFEFNWNGRK